MNAIRQIRSPYMTKQEILQLLNENPVFYLATVEENQPRVRGMLLFRADENGIIFHTSAEKDVAKQIKENPRAELCFSANGRQIRVTGQLKQVDDNKLIEEIYAHPSREFLRNWQDMGMDQFLEVYIMSNGVATEWTMQNNFDKKQYISL